MESDSYWEFFGDSQNASLADSSTVIESLVALGDEAVLEFWTWLCARAEEYVSAHDACMSDGVFAEAVELVLAGRSTFERALTSPDALGAVLGEEGFHFVEGLYEAYAQLTDEALPEPGMEPDPDYDDSWTLRMVESLDQVPTVIRRAHDAAFEALAQNKDYRAAFRAAGIAKVNVMGGMYHTYEDDKKPFNKVEAVVLRRRGDKLIGSFLWLESELLVDDFDATVNRVRYLVDRIATVLPGVPQASQIGVLDNLFDPSPNDPVRSPNYWEPTVL
ncbi:hypothetical protein [Demequina aurantiaca]|uniref:hypothetical protein n=1 Tax=Demequina aurantiaca TaxID=676200 RepID=UPI003D353E36